MRQWITANKGCWLTQSDTNPHRPRVFVKSLPVNYPNAWTNWTEEQYQEYIKENGEQTIFDLVKYMRNFDYSSYDGGIFGSPK